MPSLNPRKQTFTTNLIAGIDPPVATLESEFIELKLGRRWTNRAVNSLAGFALAVLVLRTVLVSTPEPFQHAGRIGELFYELSLAFLGAWIFNLLVIVLPRRRDQDAVLSVEGDKIAQIAFSARGLIAAMAASVEPGRIAPEMPDAHFVLRTLRRINPSDASNVYSAETGQPLSWFEKIDNQQATIDGLSRQLVTIYPYLDSELVALLARVRTNAFSSFLASPAVRGLGLPGIGCYTVPFYEHWKVCYSLERYYQTKVKPRLDPAGRRDDDYWIAFA